MAKITKIIGYTVAVSALWLGGTAYISSTTESYLDMYVKKTNNLYKSNGMEMSVENFERGFFSSNAKMKIDFIEPKLREVIAQSIKLPIEVNYELENGPLFFKNGLGFGSSRVHTTVDLSEYVVDKDAFKKMFKDDIRLTSSMSIDFFKNASFSAKTNQLLVDVDEDIVEVSPLMFEGEMNIESFEGEMKMFIDSIQSKNNREYIDIKEMVLDADITKFYDNGFYLGDFVLSVGSLSMKDELLPFELKNAKIALDMNIDENKDKNIDMKFKLHANVGESKLPTEYSSLNVVELSYALNGTKLEGLLAFQDFTKTLQAKEQEILKKLKTANGELDTNALAELEKLRVQTQDDLMMLIVGLLKTEKTNFDAEIKMIDKKAKESNLKMNIAYVGDENFPTSPRALEEKFKKELLKLISVDFDVNLEKDYIANLPMQLQKELAGQLQIGAMFGIVKENNNSYSFDVNYKPNSLMINGENRLEMLEMLEGSLPKAF